MRFVHGGVGARIPATRFVHGGVGAGAARGEGVPASDRAGVWGGAPHKFGGGGQGCQGSDGPARCVQGGPEVGPPFFCLGAFWRLRRERSSQTEERSKRRRNGEEDSGTIAEHLLACPPTAGAGVSEQAGDHERLDIEPGVRDLSPVLTPRAGSQPLRLAIRLLFSVSSSVDSVSPFVSVSVSP